MINVLGYPLERATELLEKEGVKPQVKVISRGHALAGGTFRVVWQQGEKLTAVAFADGAPARKET